MRWHVAWALVGAVAVLAGCAHNPAVPPQQLRPPRLLEPAFDGAAALPPPDMTNDGAGSLVEVKPLGYMADFDQAGVTAVRVVYRSTSSRGTPTEVSGVVAVPPGKPPKEGWPIISFGHALTGVGSTCAPSLAGDLAGYAGVIITLLRRGYVIAMSDFEGLGVPGYHHSVLDATVLGNNVIDAARAARKVLPSTSTKWAAYGTGEGGAAAWGATERAGSYGTGLELVGAVAMSPLADVSGLADAAKNGALTPEQIQLHALALQSLARSSPDMNLDDYRAGLAKDQWDLLTDCPPAQPIDALRVISQLQPGDLRPRNDEATTALRRALAGYALPGNSPAAAPLLVAFGTADPALPGAWVDRALTAACAKGEPVEIWRRIGETTTHSDLVIQSSLDWLQARFDGQPVANVCQGLA
jgi:hypothetical protein